MKKRTMLMAVLLLGLFTSALLAEVIKTDRYTKRYVIDENGERITVMNYAGFPPKELPVTSVELPKEVRKDGEKGFFALPNVPAYTWAYGCTATATAIMAAYYDNFGAPTIYTGPANGGVAPQTSTVWPSNIQADTDGNPLAASKIGVDGRTEKGHGDDYWTGYLDEATDPYYGAWTEHNYEVGQRAAADFMGTNQWYNWENADGSTSIWSSAGGVYDYVGAEGSTPAWRDGIHGVRLFYESLGLTVDWNYTRTVTGYNDPDDVPDDGPALGGYEFAMYKASIDAGRPVYIQVEGHSMIGFGYDDTATPQTLYLRDTWDTNTSQTAHSMPWMGVYSSMQMYAISEIILGTECYWAAPENVFALNDNRVVTFTWDDPSKGTKDVSYIVFRDGAQIATGVTATQYIDTTAADGVHYWSVKAYYIDDNYTSYMSKTAAAYVCASVTSFYDNFESGSGQWLFNPLEGDNLSWGIDTQYVHEGTHSLSDSPITETYTHTDTDYNVAGYYGDQTELLAAGGSIAEVAPGLNFAAAADANCSFWLKYKIEESFDYLHFQSCNDGINWVSLKIWSSEEIATWNLETISLGLFAGNPNVRFRFMLISDYGYATEGTNVDEFSIQPSLVDEAAPFVYYTKAKDYYSAVSDGFEISSKITDFTGINYASVYYKVNGSAETAVSMTHVGDIYSCKLPVFNPGDLIEFRFQCMDTVTPTANTGSKGPFYYREGLHQKYDYGTVSSYTYVVPTTVDYDMKSYAVKFSSYYDDVVGAVVRGYIDATAIATEGDNDPMLINVWADNAGLPGATLITPFEFTNPATLSETNAFAFVDLSSYTALDGFAGDFYIGFECGVGTTDMSRTVQTDCGTTQEYDFGRAYWQYYLDGSPIWEKNIGILHHIRCITTDYGFSPPVIEEPAPVVKSVDENSTDNEIVTVGNSGDFTLDYTANFTYDGYLSPQVQLHANDFTTFPGTGYTSSVWAAYTGGARTTGTSVTGILTSPAFNSSAATTAMYLDFDQNFVFRTGSYARVEYYTGSAWVQVYNATANTTTHQHIELPIKSANTQLRFTGYTTRVSGVTASWWIDNIVVTAAAVPYTWMTLDGGATATGTVAAQSTDPLTIGFNTAGLTLGNTYTATIQFVDDAGYADSKTTVVTLTVENIGGPVIPAVPTPITSSIVAGNVRFDWPDMADATSYDVYTSATPYGTFALLTNVTVSEYTYTPTATKMFFQIVSKNSTKESPETLEVKAIKKRTVKDIKVGSSGD